MLVSTQTTSKIENLAKLYLESKSVQISDSTQQELCDWLMQEFRQTPLNPQFSDDLRYQNAAEMFADIEQGHLWVSAEEGYDNSIYPNPFYGFAFLVMHDYDHYINQSDWSLEGEITAYKAAASRAPSLEIQKILYSQIVLRAAAYLKLGHAPEAKTVFP
ncbi:transposase [Myxacorys almedinensis]|uniref:Transposase n=1 Tax=Myxacorys almedinensis A TaxID=2690445 RepID=A0A8J7ZBE4_9CYAN|nr:transposase [Myxacorys almedinensis]NDJ19843.1 transposase [Myxacorys almedinensis A]